VAAPDVIVVGGGVMGCALAYQLAHRGASVTLYERGQLGGESTAKCAGGVRQQFSTEVNVHIQRLAVSLLKEFDEEIGTPAGFRQIGYLFTFADPLSVAAFRDLLPMWHRAGLAEARWVDVDEIKELVPVLRTDDLLGGTFCPTDGLASPADVTSGYAAAARRAGAVLNEGVDVSSLALAGDRVVGVDTAGGRKEADLVVLCCGAWTPQIAATVGVEVPIEPLRRHVFVTGEFPQIPHTNPMTVDFTTSLYFHPEGEGVLVGMSDRDEPPTYSQDVNWDFVDRMVTTVAHRVPPLEAAGFKTVWAGLYESTPDHQAIMGPVAARPGLWIAAGFSGHGFMQAPAAGMLLAQAMLEGRSDIDLSAFALERFVAGNVTDERNVI